MMLMAEKKPKPTTPGKGYPSREKTRDTAIDLDLSNAIEWLTEVREKHPAEDRRSASFTHRLAVGEFFQRHNIPLPSSNDRAGPGLPSGSRHACQPLSASRPIPRRVFSSFGPEPSPFFGRFPLLLALFPTAEDYPSRACSVCKACPCTEAHP